MPPHCDSLDGPVVKAARVALQKADVTGLDVGLVIPAAERALDPGSADDELTQLLCGIVHEQVDARHVHAMALKDHASEGVAAARAYIEASLGLQVWAHSLYKQAIADPHARATHPCPRA